VPLGRHLLTAAVPLRQAVGDLERRQRQRDQRGDPVALLDAERRVRADLLDRADQHAARTGDGVLHLAALGDDPQYGLLDRLAVAVVLLGQLPVRRGVQVQPLDRDPDLVGPDLRPRIQSLRGLRQHADRFQDAVQADR
jgi:hypothetical protein